jgi:hypothetical protein
VRRIVIMGRGAAGKSLLAARLGELTGLPVIELDQHFWQPGLIATPRDEWAAAQRRLARRESWIMDGDLGPYDVPGVRLAAADTVIFLDFSLPRCAWRATRRAIRRAPERADFWRWLVSYRRRGRPAVLQAIATYAGGADIHVLSTPRAVRTCLKVSCPTASPGGLARRGAGNQFAAARLVRYGRGSVLTAGAHEIRVRPSRQVPP